MNTLSNHKIVFIGAGSIAEAIIRGLVSTGVARPDHLYAINRTNVEKTAHLRDKYGIHGTCDSAEAAHWIRSADLIVTGMKPQNAAQALLGYRPLFHQGQLLISVIAGLAIDTIDRLLGGVVPIVRTMPNTPSHLGLGATGISYSSQVTDEQKHLAKSLFAAIGETAVVDESLMNMVNAISGSGPAYIYYMMEAMIEAGVQGGLPYELSRQLTLQTVLGAAAMVKETGEDPAALRRKVTSPNGTTQAAIERFDEYRFGEAVQSAVARCAERAGELRDMIGRDASALQGGEPLI